MAEISHEIEPMSDSIFDRFSVFIHAELGIQMPISKKTMLQARLQKRMRSLRINTFDEYYDYVFNSPARQEEIANMVNVVTTNKTDFFREPHQFEYLTHTALKESINNSEKGIRKTLLVWSAGCSTGEEPYTLAMVVADFLEGKYMGNFMPSLLLADICS